MTFNTSCFCSRGLCAESKDFNIEGREKNKYLILKCKKCKRLITITKEYTFFLNNSKKTPITLEVLYEMFYKNYDENKRIHFDRLFKESTVGYKLRNKF